MGIGILAMFRRWRDSRPSRLWGSEYSALDRDMSRLQYLRHDCPVDDSSEIVTIPVGTRLYWAYYEQPGNGRWHWTSQVVVKQFRAKLLPQGEDDVRWNTRKVLLELRNYTTVVYAIAQTGGIKRPEYR